MKLRSTPIIIIVLMTIASHCLTAQVTGRWKTVGEQDGAEKAIIEIYEKDGQIYGKVEKLLSGAKLTHCEKCTGELKNKPIEGMLIMRNLKKTSTGAADGKIMDPSNGKTYNCFVELEGSNKLKVRGYIGVPTVGRTQYWQRSR